MSSSKSTTGRAPVYSDGGERPRSGRHDVDVPSIWLGSQRPSTTGRRRWATSHDPNLREIVEGERRPLLLVARNSNAAGRRGCEAAAADAHDAAADLARFGGLDVSACLPSKEDLAQWLFDSPNISRFVERSGRRFSMRTCLIDLSAQGVIVCLAAGSGLKLDEDHQQPHVALIKRVLREVDPPLAGIFIKRWDRLSRSTSVDVIHELRSLERAQGSSWSGDGELGHLDLGEMAEVVATVRGMGGRAEGLAIRRKSVAGVLRRTDVRMVDGRAYYAHPAAAPPGLMRFKERRSGRNVLCLDSPAYYPDQGRASGDVPDVRHVDGRLADQVATVQWFLSNYGNPGWSDRDIVEELARRRYSTDGLRSRRDQSPRSYWGGPSRPLSGARVGRWLTPLLNHLPLYETGRFVLPVASDEDVYLTIEGVFPADGAWASATDFDRIRAFRARTRSPSKRREWSWSGMATTLNGMPARLTPPKDGRSLDGDLHWLVKLEPGDLPDDHDIQKAPRTHRWIPDDVLTAAVVGGVVAAQGQPMRPFVDDEATLRRLDSVRADRERLAEQVKATERGLSELSARITAVDDTGALVMPVSLQAKAYADWEHRQAALDQTGRDLAALDRDLASHAVGSTGLSSTAMRSLVEALRDPATSAPRAELRRAVRNLRFYAEPVLDGIHPGTLLRFEGDLVFSMSSGAFAVTVHGSHLHGPATKAGDRRLRALTRLRQGKVARGVTEGATTKVTRELPALLDTEAFGFGIASCADPQLLRLGMAVLFPDPASGEDPASVPRLADLLVDESLKADFGDVEMLARRIALHYASARKRGWLRLAVSRLEVEYLLASHLNRPQEVPSPERVHFDRFRVMMREHGREHAWLWPSRALRPVVVPCRHCGGELLAASRVPEISGYLCMAAGCRRDEAGVTWPSRFDAYLAHVDLWCDAGVVGSGNDITSGSGEVKGPALDPVIEPRVRAIDRLSPEERNTILRTYVDSSTTLSEMNVAFGITTHVVYEIARDAGVRRARQPLRPSGRNGSL